MDLSELIFTNFAPILYNGIFIILWALWMESERKEGVSKKINDFVTKNKLFYPFSLAIIVIALFLLFSYAIWNTDVDDAITSGVKAYLNGSNPYSENVVKHLSAEGEEIWGTYHYFPPDLIIYSFFYLIIGHFFEPILATYWFVPLNIVLITLMYFVSRKLIDWEENRKILFFLCIITPFIFNNSILMAFFFVMGYYMYNVMTERYSAMIFYVLSASVKYMTGLLIIGHFWRDLKEIYAAETKNIAFKLIVPYIVASIVLMITMIPFGIINVLIAVFLYQGLPEFRNDVAQTAGPLLIEILNFFSLENYYLVIVLIIVIVALVMLKDKEINEMVMHLSFLVMLILPFYATELFIVPLLYWWFYKFVKISRKEIEL